jgi:myosin heavy subunit
LQEEQDMEQIPAQVLHYYDNKPTMDELMAKPDGLFHLLDEASRTNQSSDFILGELKLTCFYWPQKFITIFTKAWCWTLS